MLRKNGKGGKKKSPRNTLAHKCRVFVKVQGLSQAERSLLLVTPQLLLHVILMSSFRWLRVKSCLVFTHFDLSRAIGPRQRPWRRHFNLRPPRRGSARLCFQRTPGRSPALHQRPRTPSKNVPIPPERRLLRFFLIESRFSLLSIN